MTKIGDLFDGRRTLSFEFFPPKNDDMERRLETAITELAPLQPDFVSVTYGAGGSTRERTKEIVLRFTRDFPFPCMAHLTCVGHSRADIDSLLAEYAAGDVHNILALAGDPPADGSDPGGDFTYAVELIDAVGAAGDFSVGVAAHPELHPRSADRATDRDHLAAKLERADFAITQFFWEVDHYRRMRDELAALGSTTPVLPSVMPFISVAAARRMSEMNGSEVPGWLAERLETVDGDPDAVLALGIEVAVDLAEQIIAEDPPGLHVYALNRSESVAAIIEAVGADWR